VDVVVVVVVVVVEVLLVVDVVVELDPVDDDVVARQRNNNISAPAALPIWTDATDRCRIRRWGSSSVAELHTG